MTTNNRSYKKLKTLFSSEGIDTDKIGFHLSKEFLKSEQSKRISIDDYAQFVVKKKLTAEYIEYSRTRILEIVETLSNHINQDSKLGRCIDSSITLSQMLDLRGIWNFIIKGCLTITAKDNSFETQHFYDLTEPNNVAAPHAWVYAPPFGIIDITIKKQKYPLGIANILPEHIAAEIDKLKVINPTVDELVDPVLKRKPYYNQIVKNEVNKVNSVNAVFKPFEFKIDEIVFRYIPVGIGLPETSLKGNQNKFNYKTVNEIWAELN